jgi:CheY-like chemotaxis protein
MEATDGHEALACIKEFRPQLVLTDLGMPVMDGLELIQRLRSNPSTAHVPVVAITADPSNQAEVKARAAGAVDFVIKPIDLSTLLDRLRAIPV